MALVQFAPYVYDQWGVSKPKFAIVNGTKKRVSGFKPLFKFYGVFPEILKKAIPTCCDSKSDIKYAKLLLEQHVDAEVEHEYDFSFPLYGKSMQDTMYQSNPFIPIIQAPSVALLVRSESVTSGNTKFIAKTIIGFWPMYLFILLIASSAGIIMWCLDRSKNEVQFPKPFINGAWEGLWWAFITMTTVGYGDRTPKSFFGRFFCILWIIFSIVIMSILSGYMNAVFSASTKKNFDMHGRKIGAVTGSAEFKFGLSQNADMQGYKLASEAFTQLQRHKSIEGMLIDNYIVNALGDYFKNYDVRTHEMIDHPITYGIRMAQGSEELEKCIRRYLRDHPQEVFDMLRKSLKPVKNPKDRENLQQKEAEKLFHQDKIINDVRLYGAILVASILFIGVCLQGITYCTHKLKEPTPSTVTHRVVIHTKWGFGAFQEIDNPLKELLEQYNSFQDGWVKKLKDIHEEHEE